MHVAKVRFRLLPVGLADQHLPFRPLLLVLQVQMDNFCRPQADLPRAVAPTNLPLSIRFHPIILLAVHYLYYSI